jgi:hypothetical protein
MFEQCYKEILCISEELGLLHVFRNLLDSIMEENIIRDSDCLMWILSCLTTLALGNEFAKHAICSTELGLMSVIKQLSTSSSLKANLRRELEILLFIDCYIKGEQILKQLSWKRQVLCWEDHQST